MVNTSSYLLLSNSMACGNVQSTVGNVFSGQVVGETAKTLSERFGKILQKRESMSINRNDTSTSINWLKS